MSNLQYASLDYISPVGDYALRNTQALSGVSQLWQDFFAQAMADQLGEQPAEAAPALPVSSEGEPTFGSDLLAHIHSQRLCNVTETEIKPPEPLFLPIAEFELDLLDKAAPPFSADELLAQQKGLDFENGWLRPIVLNAGQTHEPGPAPQPRPLRLPIAEFELDLLDKPAKPYDGPTLVEQQKQLDFDNGWARPIVLQNLRLAA
ncbi:energy transducer TonB [Pseudomonas sp. nanlin1]|uniref:energy transducer TonB n=1 Tax=Pseudomonas sp. nanlin1 TaxID=3040605 RepID=UPI0038907A38